MFEWFSASFIMSIVYVYEPKAKDDPIVHVMQRYLDLIVAALTPVATVAMETFPFLLKIPCWFPGATFKRSSVTCLNAGHDVKEIPFQRVKERMSTGDAAPCFVTKTLNSFLKRMGSSLQLQSRRGRHYNCNQGGCCHCICRGG